MSDNKLICVYDMHGASDIITDVARGYGFTEEEVGYIALAVAIDFHLHCHVDTVIGRVKNWVESFSYQTILTPETDPLVFIGFWHNVEYIADLFLSVLTMTVDFKRYCYVRPNEVRIIEGDLYLVLSVGGEL